MKIFLILSMLFNLLIHDQSWTTSVWQDLHFQSHHHHLSIDKKIGSFNIKQALSPLKAYKQSHLPPVTKKDSKSDTACYHPCTHNHIGLICSSPYELNLLQTILIPNIPEFIPSLYGPPENLKKFRPPILYS